MDSAPRVHPVALPSSAAGRVLSWSVGHGDRVRKGSPLCTYMHASSQAAKEGEEGGGAAEGEGEKLQLRASVMGLVREILVQPEEMVQPG